MAEEESTRIQPSNGEGEEDYMGDLSQFLPPEPSNTSKFSLKKVAFFFPVQMPNLFIFLEFANEVPQFSFFFYFLLLMRFD